MQYYIGNIPFDSDYLEHYGVKGMKWGKHVKGKIDDKINRWYTGQKHLDKAGKYVEKASFYQSRKDFNTDYGRRYQTAIHRFINNRLDRKIEKAQEKAYKARKQYSRAPKQLIERMKKKGQSIVGNILQTKTIITWSDGQTTTVVSKGKWRPTQKITVDTKVSLD